MINESKYEGVNEIADEKIRVTCQNACQFEQMAAHAANDACSLPTIINGIIASELFLRTGSVNICIFRVVLISNTVSSKLLTIKTNKKLNWFFRNDNV